MKITNKYNLPETFIKASEAFQKQYKKGVDKISKLTVTQLIKPPIIVRLEKEYDEQIEEDVTDRIWALTGTAMHKVLEAGETENTLSEERLYMDIDGFIISGQVDLYANKIVQDYKFTSVYKLIYNDFSDWEKQLNVYAKLYETQGFDVDKIQVVAILKDWSKLKAKTESNYPPCQVAVINLRKWSDKEVTDYINERIRLHLKARVQKIEEIEVCTEAERWHKNDTYAVKKEGRKTAVRVLDSMENAERWIENNVTKDIKKHSIELRKGEDVRCESYCRVKKWCPLHKECI
jgi:hypothetical protein